MEIPETAAILLKGSYVRGDAGPYSDLDFDVLTSQSAASGSSSYKAFLAHDQRGRTVHVSVAIHELETWIAEGHEPAAWSFGLPAIEVAKLLWARDAAIRERLHRPTRTLPASDPELEDFVEGFGKIRNAHLALDKRALRLAAQTMAQLCPTLLRLINPGVTPDTKIAALDMVLAFPIAPAGYHADMLLCLGFSDQASSSDQVFAAAKRLAIGTVELLQSAATASDHDQRFAGAFEDGLDVALADGTLLAYLNQD